MAESRINDLNYYQVNGWMINRLGLKGTPLQMYAIIYGFTQDGKSWFEGSLTYLQDFTNTTRKTVVKALKELVDKGYLQRRERFVDGVKYVTYKADLKVVKKLHQGVVEKLPQGSGETPPGVVEKGAKGSGETPPNKKSNNELDNYKYIVEYLNKKAGTGYKHTAKDTREHINARLADGHKLEDFFKVIDNKCTEWLGTEWEKYLRPATLFGRKFESYLNAKPTPPKQGNQGGGKPAPTDYGSPEEFYR